MNFKLHHKDNLSKARSGTITTDHGDIPTPIFMPVGTAGTVKSVAQKDLENEVDAKIILGNTYHLYLRPGIDLLENIGGLESVESINRRKASTLYEFIDASGFYSNNVASESRSLMNIPFHLSDSSLDEKFLQQSSSLGLLNLKGHRAVGGMRASIYNAVPEEAVTTLISFMSDFEMRYG